MRSYYLLLWTFCMGAMSLAAAEATNTNQWGPRACDARLSIRAKGGIDRLTSNQPFSLQFSLHNLSTNKTLATMLGTHTDPTPFSGLSCSVIAPSGKDISPTNAMPVKGSG